MAEQKIYWFRDVNDLEKAAKAAFSTIEPNMSFCFGRNNTLFFNTYSSKLFTLNAVSNLEKYGGILLTAEEANCVESMQPSEVFGYMQKLGKIS